MYTISSIFIYYAILLFYKNTNMLTMHPNLRATCTYWNFSSLVWNVDSYVSYISIMELAFTYISSILHTNKLKNTSDRELKQPQHS